MSIYYPQLKENVTNLGMKYVKNEESYLKSIAGKCLERYDLLEVIEREMRGTLSVSNLSFNIDTIRDYLITLLEGECDDIYYRKCLNDCYNKSPLFQLYLNYMFFIKSDINIIKDIIKPFVVLLDGYSIEIQTNVIGTYIMTSKGYLYLHDSKYKGGYSYVEIW